MRMFLLVVLTLNLTIWTISFNAELLTPSPTPPSLTTPSFATDIHGLCGSYGSIDKCLANKLEGWKYDLSKEIVEVPEDNRNLKSFIQVKESFEALEKVLKVIELHDKTR